MIFNILTLFPEIFQGYLQASILKRAVEQGLITIVLTDIRDYAPGKHRNCDDYTYGGGAGMILKPGPLAGALDVLQTGGGRIVYLTPSGRSFNQEYAEELACESGITLICGRYEGIDQRIIDIYVTDEISIGDYVLSGGEVAAMVLIDCIARLVKGVIKQYSLEEESFNRGLLEYPQYTRPPEFKGRKVPDILLSGHHAEIARWRLEESLKKTMKYRPDVLDKLTFSPEIMKILAEIRNRGECDGQD